MSQAGLRDEVVGLAQALIRLDTSNPPGAETPAAELLADFLSRAGAECELVGPDPERLNLVARVAGRGKGPSLMLMAHTDVVPAPGDGWTTPPFGAEVREGRVYGRGAADMKGELAARAVALAALARTGEPPAGDVVLVAEADEERNTAGVGMSWLVRERPDLRCDYAINEGGGWLLELAGGRVVTIAVGEKQVTSLRIRVRGRAGHASVPAGADNPLAHTASAIEGLLAAEVPARMPAAVGRALRELGAPEGSDDEVIAWGGAQHPMLADTLPAMCRMTVHRASHPRARQRDPALRGRGLRLQAATGPDRGRHPRIRRGGPGSGVTYELELLEPLEGGTESPIDTPLYAACAAYVAERLPGARLLPLISTGFTDSHWVRQAHGTTAYGFAPVFSTDLDAYHDGIHGADECLDVDDLVEMTEFNLHAIRALTPPGRPAFHPA